MGGDVALAVDVLVTWIGAAGLARYVTAVGTGPQAGALERRARFLLGTVATALFIRGFSWLAPESTTLAFLTFAAVSLLPMAMTVLAEGLMRRHVPLWMKVLSSSATVLSLAANALRFALTGPRAVALIGLTTLVALLVTLVALGVILFRRDRTSLSNSENALVRICVIMSVIALPLVATDFRFDLGWPMVRLGSLGALLLCYTLLRQPQENIRVARWLSDVASLLLRAFFFGALVTVALQTMRVDVITPVLVLGIALVMLFSIMDRVRDVERATPQTLVLRWLGRERPATWEQFARELRALPLTADAIMLDETSLGAYDTASLVAAFSSSIVLPLANLRVLRDSARSTARGADELSDLLERHGATHVGLLAEHPVRLLVVTVPELPGQRDMEYSLAAIVRRGRQVATEPCHHVSPCR